MRRFTTSDGLVLAYLDEGAGLPLLCLPGLTRNGADFDDLAAALAGRHRLIRLTLRGRGESDHDPDWQNYNVRGGGARRARAARPSRGRAGGGGRHLARRAVAMLMAASTSRGWRGCS